MVEMMYGAATLNDGRQFTLDGYMVFEDGNPGDAITPDEFCQFAKEVGVKNIEGSGSLTEEECDWYVHLNGGSFINLYGTEEVNAWLASI